MLKSCSYCGRIHDSKLICREKKIAEEKRWKYRKNTNALKFRRTNQWTNKSIDIRERDNYMCLCCKEEMKGTLRKYNTEDLSVHHIIPIEEDYDKRLDDYNLISVCQRHHEMCESGQISRERQQELVRDSIKNKKYELDVMVL